MSGKAFSSNGLGLSVFRNKKKYYVIVGFKRNDYLKTLSIDDSITDKRRIFFSYK